MTDLLEKAFREAAKLPAEAQDALASVLLAELESEREWEERFTASEGALGELADDALEEFRHGSTEPFRTQAG